MTKAKWTKVHGRNGFYWKLEDFTVFQNKADNSWDVNEGEGYLFSTRYIARAKQICERLLKSTS